MAILATAARLLDQFALAFAGLRSDGGASVQNPNSINAVLAGYQTNEYGKWVSNNTNDPTVRQTFSGYYAASAPSPLSTNGWPFYSCAQTLFTASDYSSCIESQEAVSCKTDK